MLKRRNLFRLFTGNSSGIGLIEVLIALAILGVVAVAFLSGLSTSLKAVFISDERSTAVALAQGQMEYVKSEDYSAGIGYNGNWSYTVTSSSDPTSSDHPSWWDPSNDKPPRLSEEYKGYCVEGKAVYLYDDNENGEIDDAESFDVDGDGDVDEDDREALKGIRKITITVYHSEVVDEAEKVFTLQDYKVKR